MNYRIKQKNKQIDIRTAQGLIDMFAAFEESRTLLERENEETDSLVNLDTNQAIDIEHVKSARIYPNTQKKQTIHTAELNIEDLWQKCIMGGSVVLRLATEYTKKSLAMLMELDDKIGLFIESCKRSKTVSKVAPVPIPRTNYSVKNLHVQHVGIEEVQEVPISAQTVKRALVEKNDTKVEKLHQHEYEPTATKTEMFIFVLRVMMQKIIYGRYKYSIDK